MRRDFRPFLPSEPAHELYPPRRLTAMRKLYFGASDVRAGRLVKGSVLDLVVETPQPNLVAGMKWLLGTYTSRFNRRHKLFGHLFSGRYKSLIVDGSGTGYLKSVCDSVHLNPARAKLVAAEQPLKSFA